MRGTIHLVWLALVSGPAAGCHDTAWDDVPGATLRPVDTRGDGPTLGPRVVWSEEVAHAADVWNSALAARGCPAPFGSVGPEGDHPVRLIERADWDHGTEVAGMEHSDGWIEVVHMSTPEQRRRVLVHELGHAIGLDHMGGGVMNAKARSDTPSEAELTVAADLLGCL
jgi:hypothetical protein